MCPASCSSGERTSISGTPSRAISSARAGGRLVLCSVSAIAAETSDPRAADRPTATARQRRVPRSRRGRRAATGSSTDRTAPGPAPCRAGTARSRPRWPRPPRATPPNGGPRSGGAAVCACRCASRGGEPIGGCKVATLMPDLAVFGHDAMLAAVSPLEAIERVRDGFVRHASGEWEMPAKVYLEAPPNGDFRAMPARGSGIAIVKWVSSFPGNPERGLPVVMGVICVSSDEDARPLALLDTQSVTALRTGAVAAVAAEELARPDASSAGIVGCGLHGAWAARCLAAAEYGPGVCFDPDPDRAGALAGELGWEAGSLEDALACDVVTCVTPGNSPVVQRGHLRPGMHLSMLGADGPGKAEADPQAVAACVLFCDEWEQASHGGELTGAIEAGLVSEGGVTGIGEVLTGMSPGRASQEATTLFDSTGLAIQDLAICHAVLEAHRAGVVKAG